MMRTIGLILVCVILTALPASCQFTPPTWHLPGSWEGAVCIGCGLIHSLGIVEVTDGGSYLTCAWMHSPFSGGYLMFDTAKFPVETYYGMDTSSCGGHKTIRAVGSVKVQLANGKHTFSVFGTPGTPKPNCRPYESVDANWVLAPYAGGAPLFGLPQITQKGNNSPYAGGPFTMKQRACCICSLLSIGKHLSGGGSGGTIEDFDARMLANNGYAVRDVRMPKAAWLLGIKYLGPRKYDQATITKLLGQGYVLIVKVKVPHKTHDGRLYYTQHWVAMGPGVLLDDGVRFGMMDPALRSSYFHKTSYKPQEIRVFCSYTHYMYIQNYWWLNPFQYVGNFSAGLSESKTEDLPEVQENPDVSLIWAQLSITTSTGVMIEKIEAPGLTLLANSVDASESSSLFDQISNDEHDDEDEVYEGDMSDIPEPKPDYSEAMLSQVPAGIIKVYLNGQPNTEWKLDICAFDASGTPEDKLLTGVLNGEGRAVAEVSYDLGVIVLRLGKLRGLSQEKKVFTDFLEVIDSNPDGREFFLEDRNRACGIRVVVPDLNIPIPAPHRLVRLKGKILQASPEVTIEADSLEEGGLVEATYQIQPLAFSGKWPEMANCLLARICGKVIKASNSVVVIDNGKDKMSVSGIDIPLQTGDIVAFDTILRASKRLKAIAGTITKY